VHGADASSCYVDVFVVLLSMALLWRCASRMPPPAPPAALGLLAKGSCLELAFAEPIVLRLELWAWRQSYCSPAKIHRVVHLV
jgi:hypothetical protein